MKKTKNRYERSWIGFGLRTNEKAVKEGTMTVDRMKDFDDKLNRVLDDYTLSKVIREFTPARRNAMFFVLSVALEHWDGANNFRKEDPREFFFQLFNFETVQNY